MELTDEKLEIFHPTLWVKIVPSFRGVQYLLKFSTMSMGKLCPKFVSYSQTWRRRSGQHGLHLLMSSHLKFNGGIVPTTAIKFCSIWKESKLKALFSHIEINPPELPKFPINVVWFPARKCHFMSEKFYLCLLNKENWGEFFWIMSLRVDFLTLE